MIERFRAWLAYEVAAHERVVSSLESVVEERRSSPEFAKAVDRFGHLIAARRIWLARFGVIEMPEDLFPKDVSLGSLGALHAQTYEQWRRWLETIGDEDLLTEFEYTSFGTEDRFVSTYEEILTQLFGHSWYHRGQIASLVKACGGEPAVTDYVFFTRRPVGGKA